MQLRPFLICAVLLAIWPAPAAHALEAGAAKVDITPPLGTPLNGYLDRWGRGAVDIHDPISARCLYLEDGDAKVFLINVDLCVINPELRARVLALAPGVIPVENIILTATHTHNAQGAMCDGILFRWFAGRRMPDVLEATAEGIAVAMQGAYDAKRRAAVGVGTLEQNDLSENRRIEDGPRDPQIGIVRVDDQDGAPIAILANFAAHPTTVSEGDRYTISADFPGAFYEELETLAPEGCIAMFTNGAQGDQRARNPENRSGWEYPASVGRILARRVYEAARGIKGLEDPVRFTSARPTLPPTIAASFLPSDTILQCLEIGDAVFHFFPGEPCVEIGLELRRRALERGYTAQITVGLANDHLFYFAPRSWYPELRYESAWSLYGPAIEDWFYAEFSKLMSRGAPDGSSDAADLPDPETADPVEAFPGGYFARLEGAPYTVGHIRGDAFGARIADTYQQTVVAPCDTGALIPDTGLWAVAPPFVNQTPLALPRLAVGARPMLRGLPDAAQRTLEGIADGAGLPFDAVWLTQVMPTYAEQAEIDELYRSPFCTMFAAVGDRAGADGLLVARNLDWPAPEPVVVLEERTEERRPFIQIGFPWNVGVFTGMNDRGLVVAAERVEAQGRPGIDGPPIEFILRRVLEETETLRDALAILTAATHVQGYHVMLAATQVGAPPEDADASPDAARSTRAASRDAADADAPATPRFPDAGPAACVVEFGAEIRVRHPANGLALGVAPASPAADEATTARYTRVRELTEDKRIIAVSRMQEILMDRAPGLTGRARIYSDRTRYATVFVPRERKVFVACRQADGTLAAYREFTIAPGPDLPDPVEPSDEEDAS